MPCSTEGKLVVLDGNALTFGGFDDLPYLDRVSRGTLRVHPIAPNIARETTASGTVGGSQFPAGVTVLCAQWLLHHDERYFEDPWTFRSDRWAGALTDEIQLRRGNQPLGYAGIEHSPSNAVLIAFLLFDVEPTGTVLDVPVETAAHAIAVIDLGFDLSQDARA